MPGTRSSRAADPAPILLDGCDAPLFVGCAVEVSYSCSWLAGSVTDIAGDLTNGTVRVRCPVTNDETLVDRDCAHTRLRHPPATLRAVRRLVTAWEETRRRARAPASAESAKRIAAALSASRETSPGARRRHFTAWKARHPGRINSNVLLSVDLCSGPFKSMSLSANRNLASALAVSVDLEGTFTPDVAADVRAWDVWGFLLRNCLSSVAGRVHLFLHMHASPPCTTYVMLNHPCNTRTGKSPAAGTHSRRAARVADAVVRMLVFLVRQCFANDLPVTWSIENPEASQLWNLPCMKALFREGLLVKVHVDYCMYGNAGAKPTIFAVSPLLAATSPRWAWRCRRSEGNCGAFRRESPGATAVHGGPLSHTLLHSAIPAVLCGLVNCAWQRLHSPSRANDPAYGSVSVVTARQLQAEWRAFASDDDRLTCPARSGASARSAHTTVGSSTANVSPPARPPRREQFAGRSAPASAGATHGRCPTPAARAASSLPYPVRVACNSSAGFAVSVDDAVYPAQRGRVVRTEWPSIVPEALIFHHSEAPRAKRPRRHRRSCSHCGARGELFGSVRPLCGRCASEVSLHGPQHSSAVHRPVVGRPPPRAPLPPELEEDGVTVEDACGLAFYRPDPADDVELTREEGLGCIVLSDDESSDACAQGPPVPECAAAPEGTDSTTRPAATALTIGSVSDEDFAILGGLLCSCSRIVIP